MFDLAAIAAGLPVGDALDDITARLADKDQKLVLVAPPGTGKTTVLPPLVANLVGENQRVLVVVPRRVAVRAAARRLCTLSNTDLGTSVGYRLRGDSQPGSRIDFVTPGVALRMLTHDPEMPDYAAIIIDEVHDRGVDTDLVCAFTREVCELREDLRLVVMSATVDAQRFVDFFAATPLELTTPSYPVTTTYAPYPPHERHRPGLTPTMYEHLADVAVDAHHQDPDGTILVFAPARRDCDTLAELITQRVKNSSSNTTKTATTAPVEVAVLHGGISSAEQDRLVTGTHPRIVVATSVAESSITIPGVVHVVDSTYARQPFFDTSHGIAGLETIAASRAALVQRAGRAGRERPGRVTRLMREDEFPQRPTHTAPEITTSDLSSTWLHLAAWSTPGGQGLTMLDNPPTLAGNRAQQQLEHLGAVDESGSLTAWGKALTKLPLEPCDAHAFLLCALNGYAEQAGQVIAERDSDNPRQRSRLTQQLVARVQQRHPAPPPPAEWQTKVEALLPKQENSSSTNSTTNTTTSKKSNISIAAVVAGLARPDWIGRRTQDNDYLLSCGTRIGLIESTPGSHSEWIVATELRRRAHSVTTKQSTSHARGNHNAGNSSRGLAVAVDYHPLSEQAALTLIGVQEKAATTFANKTITTARTKTAGAIVLSETKIPTTTTHIADALAGILATHGLEIFQHDADTQQLQARLAFAHHHYGEPYVDMEELKADPAAVIATTDYGSINEWLAEEITQLARGTKPGDISFAAAYQRLIPWQEHQEFASKAPKDYLLPSGRHTRIDYLDGQPHVSAKLQEVFSLDEHPTIAGEPIVFHLLSPAGRDIAITSDIPGFYTTSYPAVRKELRGRYPKHPWPEDPATAPATAATSRQLAQKNQ